MTPDEKIAAKKTSGIMRAARKQAGLTQIETAKLLGMSQGGFSKLEAGELIPSVHQWFTFCRIVGVPVNSHLLGYIENPSPELKAERVVGKKPFRLPKAYAKNRTSKARAVAPFVAYLRSTIGPRKTWDLLKDGFDIDVDYFVNLDNSVNFAFVLDLSRTLIEKGLLKAKDMDALVKPVTSPSIHGSLARRYETCATTPSLLERLVSNARHYESNFQYEIESQSGAVLELSVRPRPHLAEIPYRDDKTLGDFLCRYKRKYLESFVHFEGHGGARPLERRGIELTEAQCHFHGADRCVYRVRSL